jgi:hypothetical protein
MILSTIADKKAGCGGAGANTGKLGCPIEFGTPLHALGLIAGTVIPANIDFNKAYIQGLIQTGIAIPLIGADAFEDVSAEDAINTNSKGVDRLTLKGLPKYKFMFQEGNVFYKELAKLTSFKALDFIIGDSEGNWKMVENSNGDYAGFKAGQVIAERTKDRVQGGEPESKAMTIQFLNRIEWDSRFVIVMRQNLDFDAEEITGVNNVVLSFNQIPANLNTTLKVEVKLAADNNTFVTGLSLANFLVKKNGATITPSLLSYANGIYTLTVSALATNDELTVDLYDSIANYEVIKVGNVLYRSDMLTATVI